MEVVKGPKSLHSLSCRHDENVSMVHGRDCSCSCVCFKHRNLGLQSNPLWHTWQALSAGMYMIL